MRAKNIFIYAALMSSLLFGNTNAQQKKETSDREIIEKVMVYGSAAYSYYKKPTLGLYSLFHESMHMSASLIMGAGVKEISPLPYVFTKDDFTKSKDKEVIKKYENIATLANVGHSVSIATGLGGIYGYFTPKKKPNEMSSIDKIVISLAPYVVDIGTQQLMKDKVINDIHNNNLDGFYYNFYINQLSAAAGSTILAVAGIGDMGILAESLLPKKKYNEWYYSIARSMIGAGSGALITYIELEMINN